MSAQDSPGMSAGGSGAGPSSAKKPAKPAGGRGRGGRGRGRGRGRSGTVGPAGKGKAPADGAGEGAGEDGKNPESEVDQKKRKRGLLTRDLKHMMYGFGDVQEPDKETVDLVEDMTLDYVTNFAHRCMEVSSRRGKLQTEDLLYLIRNDEKKVQRVNELLDMNMQLKEARKNFSTDEAAIDPAK